MPAEQFAKERQTCRLLCRGKALICSHSSEQRSRSAVSCSSVAWYSSPRNMRCFISLSGIARMYQRHWRPTCGAPVNFRAQGGSTNHMLISTAPFIAGWRVQETKGQVFGLVVRSRGLGGNIMAGLRSIGGGEIHEYTQPARGHAAPGDRPHGPERDHDGRQRRSSRCASTARSWPARCQRSWPTARPWSSSRTASAPQPHSE